MERTLGFFRRIIPDPILNLFRKPYHYSLAVLAALFYRFPAKRLHVIGVTGTKGKSTTAELIYAVLEGGGHQTGLISGVSFKAGKQVWPNETMNTTLGRFATQRWLRKIANAGCTHVVIEVTSHAMYWNRVWGIPFESAVFTNLSQDHLELHKTMEKYRKSKGKLFDRLRFAPEGTSVSVVNGDDPNAEFFLGYFADTKYVFGTSHAVTDINPLAHAVVARNIKSDAKGNRFTAKADKVSVPVELKIPGAFNVPNALAAVSVGLAYGVKPKKISEAIKRVPGVSGRMERIEAGQPFTVIVDFAHTPDSFDQALGTLQKLTKGKLICVFGAPGNRDKGKFPAMGKAAAKHSNYMLLTEDDPGTEDPANLVKPLIKGIKSAGKGERSYEVTLDRRKAISRALAMAKRNDTVALLAKGHQTSMRRAKGNEPWDDRTVAGEEWKKLARNK